MKHALNQLIASVSVILAPDKPTVYLYGSCVLDDFRPGWSDIDLLMLTPHALTRQQAERLVPLRQELLAKEPGNPYYRAFEGAVVSAKAFLSGDEEPAAYWGTSGERVRMGYSLDCFSMLCLLEHGELICGEDVRHLLHPPTRAELRRAVAGHLATIRQHGRGAPSLYAYGWLLDTARCLYTLRTGRIIAKTAAGEWALREGLCPDAEALRRAIAARRTPAEADMDYACGFTEAIQRFASVGEGEMGIRNDELGMMN